MRLIWMILLIIFLGTALAGCLSGEGPVLVPETGATEPVPSSSTPETAPSETEVPTSPESSATSNAAASPTTEDIDMTPSLPLDESAQKMVTLVTQHLAQQLAIPVDQIVVSNVQPVIWRDAGLGCPKPGVDYIQVETPGYNILLKAGGEPYAYHTDESKRFVQCNQ